MVIEIEIFVIGLVLFYLNVSVFVYKNVFKFIIGDMLELLMFLFNLI